MKRRTNTSRLIAEMNSLLHKNYNTLNETMRWAPDNAYGPEANEPGFDAGPDLGYGNDYEGEGEYDIQMERQDPEVTKMINQIRQIALQGIAKLANNPTSIQYDALKKVWQIIDKTVEVKDDKKGA